MESDLKQYVGYWINKARVCMQLAFEQRLAHYKLTVPQWCVLLSLYGKYAHTISELAAYIDVDKASVSRVVERLAQRNLINHLPGKNRRTGHLQLTDKGIKLVPILLKEAEDNEKFFLDELTEREMQQLKNALTKILTKGPPLRLDGWLTHTKA